MIKTFLKIVKSVLLILLGIGICGIIYYLLYNLAEPKAYDFMTKSVLTQKLPSDTNKKVYGSDDIVLVVIDMKTVEKYRWPWKRERYCKIFDYFLNYAHPKALVYDAIITSKDMENPDSDRKFYTEIRKFNNLIMGFLPNINPWEDKEFGEKYDKKFAQKFSIKVEDKTTVSPYLYESFYTMPDDCFDAVKYAGSVSMISGFINGNTSGWARDEINRNHQYITKYGEDFYPSLAFQTYLFLNKPQKIIFTDKSIEFPELNYKINQIKSEYQITNPVRYYKMYDTGYSHINYSAIDIMNSYDNIKSGKKPVINPEEFKDKIVIIGANVTTGEGLNDNKNTPMRANHPGVDYQATVIDNIINHDFLNVIPQWINFLIAFAGMLVVYGIVNGFGVTASVIGLVCFLAGYFLISAVCFYNLVVINVITPVIMFVLTTIAAYTNKYVNENRNKEKVKNAMGKYMSEDVMKSVVQNIDNLGLGGKKAVATVLFADIRGFTSMSEKMSAQQVSEILNEYFTEMEPIITKYNGIINKFIGDAIMAVFGEPIQDENHPQNAVKCGYEMLKRVEQLQKKWDNEGKPEIEIGVGINTGEVFIGNIGSVNRMEYTVIGDTVNLASRLESYNKTYKTKMLISKSTYQYVKDIADVIKIPEVQIRGKSRKIDIYQVLKVNLK